MKDSKYFDYKTSITGKLEGNNVEKDDVKIVVPLKYLSNFWRTLDMSLINSELSLNGKLEGNNGEKVDVKIVVPLKYLSNFCRKLDM